MSKDENKLILLLKLGMASYLFSRGMLYLTFDSPLRALLWSESIVSPFVNFWGMTWQDYANVSDYLARILEKTVGLYFIFAAGLCFYMKAGAVSLWQKRVFHVLAYFTALHILLKYLALDQEIPIMLEYVLQGFSPLLFLAFLHKKTAGEATGEFYLSHYKISATRLLISACFIGHGLYAAGWPYQSVKFVRMLSGTFFIDFELAAAIVQGIGIIDIMLGIIVFIKAFEQVSLIHMAFWGFVTAGSRIVSQVIVPNDWSHWHLWSLETSVRLIHGVLPLFLFLYLRNQQEEKESFDFIPCLKQSFKILPSFIAKTAVLILTFSLGVKLFYAPQSIELNDEYVLNEPPAMGMISVNSSGESYCDETFSEQDFPVRLKSASKVDLDAASLKFLSESKQELLTQLKRKIILDFQGSAYANEKFDEAKILGFAKNVQVIYGEFGRVDFRAEVPWRSDGAIAGSLSQKLGAL
ncbi:hypothetical protein LNTAR_06549 [Lentisphaera araneosa HTCC2155]|uniref:Uncharacterized protein n=1 Tax=Lentisphaera araneosa HTCC2155 TaxID=313628 RepID=A6DND6_9BACT|nr:hypothetical protein [Lentisphaera araneosa]EDM26884.1 hypothetical protein LNTAR_06549 [Lentisphaera araneosa HTCC2155]